MVQYNRIELLNHPVCKKYLAMKWCVFRAFHSTPVRVNNLLRMLAHGVFSFVHRVAYGSIAHVLNMFLYLLGLLPLTHLIVALRPSVNITDTSEQSVVMVPVSFTEVLMAVLRNIKEVIEKCIITNVCP